jgi:hypothetical protein
LLARARARVRHGNAFKCARFAPYPLYASEFAIPRIDLGRVYVLARNGVVIKPSSIARSCRAAQ